MHMMYLYGYLTKNGDMLMYNTCKIEANLRGRTRGKEKYCFFINVTHGDTETPNKILLTIFTIDTVYFITSRFFHAPLTDLIHHTYIILHFILEMFS